jgi:DNA-binding transcriptional LysR family regulator
MAAIIIDGGFFVCHFKVYSMDELRRIDLNLLLTLHALLTEKHVTRASVRLHKSQPAVSHALAQLRAHFDDPLLIRRDGAMELSARARAMVKPLQEALGGLNGLLSKQDFEPASASGRFRLALSDYAARIVLPPLVRHVRQCAPGLELAISQASTEAMLAQLHDGELDLAFGLFPAVGEDIRVQSLFQECYISLADKQALPQNGVLSVEEWLARPHVKLALRPDAVDEIDRTLLAKGLERKIALTLPHWSAAVDVLRGTDLVMTVASRAVDDLPIDPCVHRFEPPLPLPRYDYHQAWHARREDDPAHRWLRQAVLTCSRAQ